MTGFVRIRGNRSLCGRRGPNRRHNKSTRTYPEAKPRRARILRLYSASYAAQNWREISSRGCITLLSGEKAVAFADRGASALARMWRFSSTTEGCLYPREAHGDTGFVYRENWLRAFAPYRLRSSAASSTLELLRADALMHRSNTRASAGWSHAERRENWTKRGSGGAAKQETGPVREGSLGTIEGQGG